jgi:diguanylate cyclase (GGDEF)-like protein
MTILIAEDDVVSSLVLQRSLEGLNLDVVAARDGEEAWKIIQARDDIRLVISDWMMPKVDGLDLCRRIRGLADRPYIYFILLTAKAFREDRLAGLGAGADDFLTKPLDRADLAARIKVAQRLIATQEELRDRSLQLEKLHDDLRQQNARLAELATCDGLTGLKNHRYFRTTLEAATSFALRQGLPLSLIMLDVDNFKSYNDTYGHPAGDEVLSSLGRLLRQGVREHDLVARYGGEEFVVLLPATDVAGSRVISARIHLLIASADWPLRAITASLGIATTRPGVDTPNLLVDLADRALYESKARGRDTVTHADELPDAPRQAPDILKFVAPFLGQDPGAGRRC